MPPLRMLRGNKRELMLKEKNPMMRMLLRRLRMNPRMISHTIPKIFPLDGMENRSPIGYTNFTASTFHTIVKFVEITPTR